VFRLTRPGAAEVAAFLAGQREARLTYPEVGATRDGAPPSGYAVDRSRVLLGSGPAAFARAEAALRAWRMATLGWAAIQPPDAPIAPGVTVAMLVRHYGLWSLNACRLIYVLDDETNDVRRVGFGYGTLPAHAAVGEERFAVEWTRADDRVWYDLYAFSRPGHLLTRLGYPLARRLQRRFGRDSKAAMVAAVRGAARARAVA
jgi:uncharacterized protein (UPF0548 family)